jgi:hypothetical protein
MKLGLRAALAASAVIWSGPALAQVPPSNFYERQMLDINRSLEQRQRDIQREQQREFETNQRLGAPRTQRMPGEPRPGCPAGSAGC